MVSEAKKSIQENKKIFEYSEMNKSTILKYFSTTEKGYSSKTASKILNRIGKNQIDSENKTTNFQLLIRAFFNPFSILLIAIIGISVFTNVFFDEADNYSTVLILIIIIVISGTLHFVQDLRSKKSLKRLKDMVINTTAIMRDGAFIELPLTTVVPGDIIQLSAGDIIPADSRILSCKDLFLSQSSFTGESEPTEKFENVKGEINDIFELSNICFMGTNVISGSATIIIIATGEDTYLGRMSKTMGQKQEVTAFDAGINKVSSLLIKITLVMVPLVFFINTITKGDVLTSFIFAVTIAVGITPEMLPLIIASNLAKGSVSMAKHKTIIKNLNSIQNLGAIDVLCTDKTGTLTEDNIILDEYLDVTGNVDMRILKYAYLNSHFQTGLQDLLDRAIIIRAKEIGLEKILPDYEKIDEIPFDFARRRMSIILEKNNHDLRLITKGAPEEILAISSHVEYNGKIEIINDSLKEKIKQTIVNLNKKGLRVIAIARKNDNISDTQTFKVKDESDMIMIGFVSFLDPPKATAKQAINVLYQYGVAVKVITGDNELVAKKVCNQVGIDTKYSLNGSDIENMTDDQLLELIEETTLFAKIAPLQKSRIVKLLQQKGHVVGYMGDGINDAPALIQADVGISVDTGVDIAKESANIILLEKSLLVLGQGIIEGRKVFANIMKYLNMATSSNVGNMISVIFASIFIPFLPLLPIHILIQNLLYDFSQTSIPFDHVDEDYLMKPRKWETKNISKFILWFAPISSIFDLTIFAVLWFFIGANTVADQAIFQTGWFVMGLLSQTMIVHIIRTKKLPFIQSRASKAVVITTLIISIIGLILPITNIGAYLGLVELPALYFIWLAVIMVLYILLAEKIKKIYIKKYGEWL